MAPVVALINYSRLCKKESHLSHYNVLPSCERAGVQSCNGALMSPLAVDSQELNIAHARRQDSNVQAFKRANGSALVLALLPRIDCYTNSPQRCVHVALGLNHRFA
jgi:hypothetical protein